MFRSLVVAIVCLLLWTSISRVRADEGLAKNPISASEVSEGRSQAAKFVAADQVQEAVVLLNELLERLGHTPDFDDAAHDLTAAELHLEIGRLLTKLGYDDEAMAYYFDVAMHYNYGEETRPSQALAISKMAETMLAMPEASARYWLWSLRRLHLPEHAYRNTPEEDLWLVWMTYRYREGSPPTAPANSPFEADLRFLQAERMIHEGKNSDPDMDDPRTIGQIFAEYPRKIKEGLALLEGGKWGPEYRDIVAALTAYGYAHIKLFKEGARRLEQLAQEGDPGGVIRFRAALLRADPPCSKPECAWLSSSSTSLMLSELLYRSFCAGDDTGSIASALDGGKALIEEMKGATHWDDDRARFRNDVTSPQWPLDTSHRTKNTMRRWALSAETMVIFDYYHLAQKALADFTAQSPKTRETSFGKMMTQRLEKRVKFLNFGAHELAERNLKNVTRDLKSLVTDGLPSRTASYMGIRDINLKLDREACTAYQLEAVPEAPPPARVSRGCAGCAVGDRGVGGAWILLLFGLFISVRRRGSQF